MYKFLNNAFRISIFIQKRENIFNTLPLNIIQKLQIQLSHGTVPVGRLLVPRVWRLGLGR
jgi:hypothetical protein